MSCDKKGFFFQNLAKTISVCKKVISKNDGDSFVLMIVCLYGLYVGLCTLEHTTLRMVFSSIFQTAATSLYLHNYTEITSEHKKNFINVRKI